MRGGRGDQGRARLAAFAAPPASCQQTPARPSAGTQRPAGLCGATSRQSGHGGMWSPGPSSVRPAVPATWQAAPRSALRPCGADRVRLAQSPAQDTRMPPGLGCGGSECPWKDASFLTCSGPVGQFSLSLVLCVSRGTAWSSGPAGPGLADSCALTERPPIQASLGRCPRESRGLPGTLPSAGKWSEERVTKRRCAPGVHRPASQGVGESLAPRGAHAHPERGGLCCSRVGLAWSLEWSGLGESPSVQEPCPHQDVYQRGACSGCPPNPVPTDPILLTLKLGDTCIPDKRVLMARAHSPQSAEQRPLRQGGGRRGASWAGRPLEEQMPTWDHSREV